MVLDQLAPNSTVVIRSSNGLTVLTTTADANGRAIVTGLPVGTYTIEATDAAGAPKVRTLEVLGNQASRGPDSSMAPGMLALTGSSPVRLILTSLVLLAAGFILQRRRKA